ncbi:MmcQ/YjbR family DNA-binding protein [Oceanobacillus jeddahense]|uniref:MmcQ/YjbR family DNA-binding protein n=1 Tax=Oceanobacillus jeddahense TaxID=1462527 RepID=UPI000595DB42|nr:MmcQ/YjbR family DNA-binding protein [Oceanobacillus jeddahense]
MGGLIDVKPDYPWEKFPNFAALRHKDNKKWFGLIMNITEDKLGIKNDRKIDVLNVKARKEFIGSLRKNENIYPAYHMDKDNWVSIVLDYTKDLDDIRDLIAESYELTI